jgi:mono/diheme cytochrome c family protein
MIRRWNQRWITVLIAAVVSSSGLAQTESADPDKGKALAETLCSGCHNVWMGPVEREKNEIPSFYDFANRPDQTPKLLSAGIIFPHPEMPRVPFTNEELKNIVAYIMSLRTPD